MGQWQQGSLVEVEITALSDRGDGVGRWGDRVVFVPDTVTGDRAQVRLVRVKKQYAHGKVHKLLDVSPHRIRPRCLVADKCGGCQWQHIADNYQQTAKTQVVTEAIERIGQFSDVTITPILPAVEPLHYRNKVTYPLGRSIGGTLQAGYYRKGTHQLVNLNQCPVQDQKFDILLAEIKLDIAYRGWSIYDEEKREGRLRHFSLRVGRRTGEILLTLVSRDLELPDLEKQAQAWLDEYPAMVGVCVNINPQRTNVIFGDRTVCIVGQDYLTEEFAGLRFRLQPTTFFQVNTETAEALLTVIEQQLELQGTETLLDAYCGIGTFTLPLAHRVARAMGVESQAAAIAQAEVNAEQNQITNAEFHTAKVEDWLAAQTQSPDIVLLDPPRRGCERTVIDNLLRLAPAHIVYISCKPATLARDLKLLCEGDRYRLVNVQPADFFPQTAHVEAVAFLARQDNAPHSSNPLP